MYAIHSTLLPPSAIHHTLYLPHFTPSTIYPIPRPSSSTSDIRVIGNLIVGGISDLRVFEIREESRAVLPHGVEGINGNGETGVGDGGGGMVDGEELGDGFLDNGPSQRSPIPYQLHRTLHHLTTHQLHGNITGLAALRTIDSTSDGLDRLLVSFKDAKMAILEWSQGDIATVSMHTYERCSQMTTGDLSTYVPKLRTDPLSRIALLTLPDDALAVLPVVQEQSDLDLIEAFPRDVPYSPSLVLSLSDVSPQIKNLVDLIFLPGFHSPTLALLYSPTQTWAGRYHSAKDTFVLEIRTLDLSAGSYPLLTRVDSLPSDSLYIVPCPRGLGGIVLVTTTGIIHVDQSGRVVCTSVNAWWGYTTNRPSPQTNEGRQLSLEGSRAIFVGEKDLLLVLSSGKSQHVRLHKDGRAVDSIIVEEELGSLPPPSALSTIGGDGVFVGCPEGDSVLYGVEMIREKKAKEEEEEEAKPVLDMEVDYDDDLYADSNPIVNGSNPNPSSTDIYTGPARLHLKEYDRLTGIGKIIDMEFGIAVTDQGQRTYPQLVAIGGGSRNSTFNVLRRGIPINKRRRFNELSTADGVWFLPIQRQSGSGQKFRNVPQDKRTTLLLSSEGSQTRVFALSNKANPEQIGRLTNPTVHAAPFFDRNYVLHTTPHSVDLLDSDGKYSSNIYKSEEIPIVSASISDPYAVIRRSDGKGIMFVGDGVEKSIVQVPFIEGELPPVQAIEVFTDVTGIYRTFEQLSSGGQNGTSSTSALPHANGSSSSMPQGARNGQYDQQFGAGDHTSVSTLSGEESTQKIEGTQWLAILTSSGELQIRSLPDLSLVFQSEGLAASQATFTDDPPGGGSSGMLEDPDEVKQMLFHPLGRDTLRPHLLVLHKSGRLNTYEAQPRFTPDPNPASLTSSTRPSLAIRYRRVHTQLLTTTTGTKLTYKLHPFSDLEGYTGVFVTGEKPQWVIGSSGHPVRSFGLKQAAATFGVTTHLGGMGEYFIRIEDGTFICYLPASLTTDFEMPCDRYEMDRVYTNIAFDPPSGHYVGAAAITVPFQAYDEEGEIQMGPEGENLIPPTNERSTLELFSQGSDPWRVIDGYDFDQNEVVLCMQSVNLESSSQISGHRDFIAVGTGFDFAEDRATRGNAYIFEVVETVGESPKESGWRLKIRARDPARNPVSALGNINGYLLNSNGPKLYCKGLDYDQRLMGLAFLDVNLYLTSIRVLKNFMLVTDLLKSIWLVSLQDEPYKLTTISKDLREVHAISGDFLVQEGQVTFLITDRKGDMRMLDFDPADPESINGERLILRTEYHMGSPITVSKTIARRRTTDEEFAPQSQLVYGTADGSLTTIVAVKPARFKRLQLVAEQLTRNAQHTAGLNPKAYRTVQNDLLPKPLSRGILDGQLLSHFALQPVKRQREMMRQIGTDEVTVASDLQALGGFW